MSNLTAHYFLRPLGHIPEQHERQVTKEEFVKAERRAGFYNTIGQPDEPATAGFSTDFMRGRVVYSHDPETIDRADKLFLILKTALDGIDKRAKVEQDAHNPDCDCGYFDGFRAAMNDLRAALQAAHSVPPAILAAFPDELRGDGPCWGCGTPNNIHWFTENVLWNEVVGGPGTMDDPGGILCVPCFVIRVDRAGYRPNAWRLLPSWPWARKDRPADRLTLEPVEE